jgi:hypothetical protein
MELKHLTMAAKHISASMVEVVEVFTRDFKLSRGLSVIEHHICRSVEIGHQ